LDDASLLGDEITLDRMRTKEVRKGLGAGIDLAEDRRDGEQRTAEKGWSRGKAGGESRYM
jgi:hypothetical protein